MWGCSRTPPRLRLVRQIAPSGAVRVLATKLGEQVAPAHAFADLYHQRWRIEEAFKRLKHRMKLVCGSGLSQHALLIDVAAMVLADNLASLMCGAAALRPTCLAGLGAATGPTRLRCCSACCPACS